MNERDCPHGHKLGKCDTCELIVAEARIAELEAALGKLARLGNEPNYGNSTGNVIARRALLQEDKPHE
jgi:hypothetical protein